MAPPQAPPPSPPPAPSPAPRVLAPPPRGTAPRAPRPRLSRPLAPPPRAPISAANSYVRGAPGAGGPPDPAGSPGRACAGAAAWRLLNVLLRLCSSELRRPLRAGDGNPTASGRGPASEMSPARTCSNSPLLSPSPPKPSRSFPKAPRPPTRGSWGRPLPSFSLCTPPIGGAWLPLAALLPLGAHLHRAEGRGLSQSGRESSRSPSGPSPRNLLSADLWGGEESSE